jgi:hypothetical protein
MPTSLRIAAEYLRGGTSKGLFMHADAMPPHVATRDHVLLRALGSPDPYGRQMDGMGAATSSTSKVVLVRPSTRPDCDVEFLFGAVSIREPLIDWTGNCGNLTTAVGPFAIRAGFVTAVEPITTVRLWQANLAQRIIARVPVRGGQPREDGDFELDGVAFTGAPIELEFLGSDASALLPTSRPMDVLDVPGVGRLEATLIVAGNPTVIVTAESLGLTALEQPPTVNGDAALLARCEAIRAHAAMVMGLVPDAATATRGRPATPRLAFIAAPCDHVVASGRTVRASDIDLVARILSMGALHHAFPVTAANGLAAAAALPGSIVSRVLGGRTVTPLRLGHASGSMRVGAKLMQRDGTWRLESATVTRTARLLMSGFVHVPV